MKYILKTTQKDGITYNDFKWPTEVGAKVTAPDWLPTPECGKGLHGWLNGKGDGTIGHIGVEGCVWMVLGVEGEIIELNGKVKFESCVILHVGDQLSATQFLRNLVPESRAMIGEQLVVGNNTIEMTGDYGSITGGDYSTLTGGKYSILTGREYSTLTGGNRSTLTGGNNSTLTGGDRSTLTGGDRSTLTGGEYSTLTGGSSSTLTGGDRSILTGGYYSILTGGNRSTLTGGDYSTLTFKIWDVNRYRLHTFYVGEDGIEPNVAYKFENGKIVKI
jgi:hypothetical protein